MIRLLVAELRRIAARRVVRVTVLLALVGIALGGVAAFAFSDSLSEEAYQQRVLDAEAREAAQDAEIEACLDAHGVTPSDERIPDDVAEACFPDDEPAGADDPRFHRKRLEGVLHGVTGTLAIIGWALGATLVGAEFTSRSMTSLLTWEPRRWRVFIAKSIAAVATMSLFAARHARARRARRCGPRWPSTALRSNLAIPRSPRSAATSPAGSR